VFVLGFPSAKTGSMNRHLSDSTATVTQLHDIASETGKVGQIILSPGNKHYGWVEFLNTQDATAFRNRFTEKDPLMVRNRACRVEYGTRRPALGGPSEVNELAIRYNITGISSEEAVKLAQQKYPDATITTNVKSSRGFLGTIFAKFEDVEAAQTAFAAYWGSPLVLGETNGECVMPAIPNPEVTLYNLKPFIPFDDVLEALKKFGEISKYRFAFQRYGPNYTGRARVSFNEVSQAQALIDATMNEELVIQDLPVRAEYFMMRFNPSPMDPSQGSQEPQESQGLQES